eukprot:430918-Rhodomonas_salina.1
MSRHRSCTARPSVHCTCRMNCTASTSPILPFSRETQCQLETVARARRGVCLREDEGRGAKVLGRWGVGVGSQSVESSGCQWEAWPGARGAHVTEPFISQRSCSDLMLPSSPSRSSPLPHRHAPRVSTIAPTVHSEQRDVAFAVGTTSLSRIRISASVTCRPGSRAGCSEPKLQTRRKGEGEARRENAPLELNSGDLVGVVDVEEDKRLCLVVEPPASSPCQRCATTSSGPSDVARNHGMLRETKQHRRR